MTIYLKFRQFFKTVFLFTVPNYLQGTHTLQYKPLWLIFLNKNTSTYVYKMNLISFQVSILSSYTSILLKEILEDVFQKCFDWWIMCIPSQGDYLIENSTHLINKLDRFVKILA